MKKINKGDVLQLPDGTTIAPGGDGQAVIETPEEKEAAAQVDTILTDPFATAQETFQRTLADVRPPVDEFNPVMLILAYSMWGLDAHAIARYLSLDLGVVEGVQTSELYTETRKQMIEAIRYAEASTIHGFLFQQARSAAVTVASAMKSKSEDVRMSAAKDILDRSGFRPIDRVDHVHAFEDELRIVHVTQKPTPKIDVGV